MDAWLPSHWMSGVERKQTSSCISRLVVSFELFLMKMGEPCLGFSIGSPWSDKYHRNTQKWLGPTEYPSPDDVTEKRRIINRLRNVVKQHTREKAGEAARLIKKRCENTNKHARRRKRTKPSEWESISKLCLSNVVTAHRYQRLQCLLNGFRHTSQRTLGIIPHKAETQLPVLKSDDGKSSSPTAFWLTQTIPS